MSQTPLTDTSPQSLPVILNIVKQILRAPDEATLQHLFSQVTMEPTPSIVVEAVANRRAAFADQMHRQRTDTVNRANLALARALSEEDILDILIQLCDGGHSAFGVLGYMTASGQMALEVLATQAGGGWNAPVNLMPMTFVTLDDYPLLTYLLGNPHPMIYCDDIEAEQDLLDEASRAYLRQWHAHAVLIMPLSMQDELVGLFCLCWAAPQPIPAAMRELYEAIRPVTAATIANRRLMRGMELRFEQALMDLAVSQQEREQLQQQVIEAQKQALAELSTPIIPIFDDILVMPLIGSIDTARAQDIMRALLKGISDLRAKVVIIDITGVPVVDSGVAAHLNKTIQAARLKGARTIITGITDAVAETVVDLGIDWNTLETQRDLQTGLTSALNRLGRRIG